MTQSLKSVFSIFFKYIFGFAVLAYVVAANWEGKDGKPGIKDLLTQTPDYAFLAFTLLLSGVAMTCQILRWYLLVRALDLPFTLRNAFRLGMIGYFYNIALPGSIGGDFLKAFFIAKAQPDRKAAAVATVLIDRMLGLFGLLLFVSLVGGSLWLSGDLQIVENPYLTKIITVCTALVVAAVIGWIVLGLLPSATAERIGLQMKGVPVVGKTLNDLWEAVLLYRRRPKLLYLTLPLTAFAQFLMILYLHLGVRVFPNPDPASFGEHFVIGPIGFIAQAFFPAPGGVGGAEAIFGYLYTLIGRPEITGIVGRLTLRAAEIVLGSAGLTVYLSMKAELPVTDAAGDPAVTA